MPDVLITTGVPHMAHQNITSPFASQETGWEQVINLGRGIVDENIVAKGTKYVIENIFNERPELFRVDAQYDPYHDPQLFKYKEFMGNFLHSKSKEHTTYLIDRFVDKNKKINGSPMYIIGRIIGGITDPSSLFLFTKAGSVMLTGSRLARSAKFGGLIGVEEAGKRFFDDTRPMTESSMITAGGLIIPALFPAINNKLAGKKFDDHASMLDDVDDLAFGGGKNINPKFKKLSSEVDELEKEVKRLDNPWNHKISMKEVDKQLKKAKKQLEKKKKQLEKENPFLGSTVGAAQTRVDKAKVKAMNEMNQIQPTGLGIFGEQGPWNPIFRVLRRNMLVAQDFIESVLEMPLYQKKNFAGGITSPSIERSVKKRYGPTVVTALRNTESRYNEYLKRNGINQQNFFERTFDTKFGRNSNSGNRILSPKEFREEIWDARMANMYKTKANVSPEAKAAAKDLDDYFKPLGTEYDELGITQSFIQKQISQLEEWIKKTTSNSKKAYFISLKRQAESRLAYINEHGAMKKDSYLPMMFKRDVIEARFDEFKALMTKMLKDKGTPDEVIDEVIEQFKMYQPVIRFPNIADELKSAAEKGVLIDVAELAERINKVSARFRARDLNIDYRVLAQAGFIEKDVQTLTKLYFNQVVPDIEITKIFGDPMGYGFKYTPTGPYKMGILQISELYDDMINSAKSVTQKESLIIEKNKQLTDLDSSIALIRGTYGLAEDPNRSFSRGVRIMKLYNSMTMLTGIAQTVDTARLVMINGIGKTFRMNWEIMTSGYAKEIWKMNMKTTQLGGEALDLWNSSRAMAMYGMDDAFGVFNKFERGMSGIGNLYFTFLNLSNPWNTAVKNIASLYNGTRMLEAIEGLVTKGKISKVNRARLKNLGITDGMAKDIWEQYIKYGVGKGAKRKWTTYGDSYKSMRVANTDAWKNKKAANAYHDAIGKQANIDIVTPSKGDVPLWANTEIGGMITQFKKFGMAATQRMLMRGLQEKDANFLTGVLMLLAAGAAVDAFRQRAFDRSYAKKPFGQKVVDAFDRSGLGGIYSDINNSIERLANNEIGLRPLLNAKKPYGTYRDLLNNPIPDVLGPTASQIANISDIAWTWGTGKYNHHTARNVRRLLPFQNVWFLDSLFDEVERDVLR